MSNLSDILGAAIVANEELAMRRRLGFSSTTQQVQTASGKSLNIVMIAPAATAASKAARIIDRKFINASTTSVTTISYSGIAAADQANITTANGWTQCGNGNRSGKYTDPINGASPTSLIQVWYKVDTAALAIGTAGAGVVVAAGGNTLVADRRDLLPGDAFGYSIPGVGTGGLGSAIASFEFATVWFEELLSAQLG